MMVLALLVLLAWHGSSAAGAQAGATAQPATAPAPASGSSSSSQLFQLPFWASADRSADIVLNFTTADAAQQQQEAAPVTFRGKPLASVSLRKGYFHGNVAVVRFGGHFITAVRKIQFYLTPRTSVADYPLDTDPKKKWISWWTNRISLCTADPNTLQPQRCTNFDPRNWTDCMWNGGFETLGPEDPRLIIWPSKGLFVMFNSKPWPLNPAGTKPEDTQCSGPWAQQPWLMPLTTYMTPQQQQQQQQQQGGGVQGQDPWVQGLIRLQYLPPELRGGSKGVQDRLAKAGQGHGGSGPLLHKQKNWNPFIYNDEIFFSQSFMPHVVIKPSPDGSCSVVHRTDGLAFGTLPAKPRGNTQAALLPAALTGLGRDVYLGVVHTEVDRKYENFFYQMEAEPPFAITAVSSPLPLVPGQHPRVPAWGHISFPMSLQLLEDTHQVMLGYGSGDQVPRVKFMPLQEVLAMFDKGSTGAGNQQQPQQQQRHRQHQRQHVGLPAAATDGSVVGGRLAGKLGAQGLSPRAQAAAQAAVAAVEQAMGAAPATAPAAAAAAG